MWRPSPLHWLLIPLIVVGGLVVLPSILRLFGWHITSNGGSVAPYLVEHHRSPRECHNIIYLNLTPSPSEVRIGCIAQYAWITKDPTACELLMPSEYGRSCIWEAIHQIDEKITCDYFKEHGILCYDREGKQYKNPQCSDFVFDALLQQRCELEYAIIKHEPERCAAITNTGYRAGCELGVRYIPGF
jgi:hypothetical protein